MPKDMMVRPMGDFISKEVGNELVAINMNTGEYHSFNSVGGAIWEAITEKLSFESIVERLVNRFDVEGAKAESETLEFIRDLLRQGLLEAVE